LKALWHSPIGWDYAERQEEKTQEDRNTQAEEAPPQGSPQEEETLTHW
jgi:hypothetical protein